MPFPSVLGAWQTQHPSRMAWASCTDLSPQQCFRLRDKISKKRIVISRANNGGWGQKFAPPPPPPSVPPKVASPGGSEGGYTVPTSLRGPPPLFFACRLARVLVGVIVSGGAFSRRSRDSPFQTVAASDVGAQQYHMAMVNDAARNAAYELGLQLAVKRCQKALLPAVEAKEEGVANDQPCEGMWPACPAARAACAGRRVRHRERSQPTGDWDDNEPHQGGGEIEVRNFSQFSAISQFFAIFRNFSQFSAIFPQFFAIGFDPPRPQFPPPPGPTHVHRGQHPWRIPPPNPDTPKWCQNGTWLANRRELFSGLHKAP